MEVAQDYQERQMDRESLKDIVKAKCLEAMIVDDAPFNHIILTNYFEKLGVKVTSVTTNGLEAYEKYLDSVRTGTRPHIVAMDIDMPVMNGKDASRRIRELEASEGLTPCFIGIVSGNCTGSEIRECLDKEGRIKADSFIKKPASIDELLKAIGHHFVE